MTAETIIGGFLAAVDRHADRPAILTGPTTVRYAELAAAAGGLSALIGEAGPRSGEPVGLLTERGAATVPAILGALAAGAAYVPLDPSYPRERLARMVAGAGVSSLLVDDDHLALAEELAEDGDIRILRASEARSAELRPSTALRSVEEPAYILFTSGSSGVPKAVAQNEPNLLRCVANQIAALDISADDRLSLLASFSFDAAIPDLFPALLSGAALVPLDAKGQGLADAAAELAAKRVTVYHSTPTVYRYLLDTLGPAGRLPDVRAVLLGGEPTVPADLLRGRDVFGPACVFVNGYGSTEATFSAQYRLQSADLDDLPEGSVPIGRALPGYGIRLRGGESEDEGEIVVRSPHVALGYWRDEKRTRERFGTDADGTRWYRTGDLGRRLPDGRLVCLGRLDRQIKVRGFRVEPGEVEARLDASPHVARSVVVGRGGELVAYIQAANGPVDAAALRADLSAVLPDYLVPNRIVVLDALPMTPSGKIDSRALPEPTAARPGSTAAPTASMDPVEHRVHDLWCAVLGIPGAGLDDAFFDAGGHSLALGVLQRRLADEFGVPVTLVQLLEHATIRAQARLFGGPPPQPQSSGTASGEPRPDLPTADSQTASAQTPDRAPIPPRETTGEEIAVIGLAGRFPGAENIDAFWWNLCAGVDAVHDYDDDELRALGIGPRLLADPSHVKAGGRLGGVEDFDAALFRFGDDEAARTDPQHRLMLECAWEALEDAGCDPSRTDGSIGVFTSASVNRYFLFHLFGNPALGEPDPDDWEGRLVPHQLPDHLPGQVAYRLGLGVAGPVLSVQSACSSSLVATCLAAQSLADYRCDVALVGGVSVTWPRYRHKPDGMVSPDGRCRAFDAAGQGAGFSSGVGAVVLKRLADAEADGDRVYAVIPGWAVANDGAARAGFAVPGVEGQVTAIAEALADADVHPDEVGLVEAHGSGTPLGDAIEAAALTRAFRAAGASRTGGCALGSVKTNVGHLDAAAGVAGLIKAVLAVHHGRVPGNLHYQEPNPEIDLADSPFHIPTKTADWPVPGRRVAAVNAIGVGGTNAHVLVEQAPAARPASGHAGPYRLALSGHTPEALRQAADRLRAHLTENPDISMADVEHTLASGRRRLAHQMVVDCADRTGALAALSPERVAENSAPWPEDTDGRLVRLPAYPFQRRRHWIEPPPGEVR